MVARDKDDLPTQLQLVDRVLTHDPGNARALTILADLSSRPAAQTAQAAALLDKTLSGQEPPAVVNMVLGTRELHQGNLEQALALLERANTEQSSHAHRHEQPGLGPGEPGPARTGVGSLAQAARKLSNHPEIQDTLGTILARMGRHEEAVIQLETARPPSPAARRSICNWPTFTKTGRCRPGPAPRNGQQDGPAQVTRGHPPTLGTGARGRVLTCTFGRGYRPAQAWTGSQRLPVVALPGLPEWHEDKGRVVDFGTRRVASHHGACLRGGVFMTRIFGLSDRAEIT